MKPLEKHIESVVVGHAYERRERVCVLSISGIVCVRPTDEYKESLSYDSCVDSEANLGLLLLSTTEMVKTTSL